MKEIRTRVQPNPMEYSVWIDLNEDPHGSVKKHWNGEKWVSSSESDNTEIKLDVEKLRNVITGLINEIEKIRNIVNKFSSYDDTKVHERINKLNNRVKKLENTIIVN